MDIVVLAGGLSSERDVSFKSGAMVAEALRARGHRALVLDVFMGYSDKECDITDIFEDSVKNSVQVDSIPTEAPDIPAIIASRPDKSPSFFGPNVIKICQKADIVFMALHGGDVFNFSRASALVVFEGRFFRDLYHNFCVLLIIFLPLNENLAAKIQKSIQKHLCF